MEKQVLGFAIKKETPGCRVYEEVTDGKPPVVGTLYVKKWAKPADKLAVTIEEVI